MKTIRVYDSEGWMKQKEFDNDDEFLTTLVNANVQNKRGYVKVVTDIDGDIVTIKSVPTKRE